VKHDVEKFIFIITYGRSGSTVLTRILNLIKNSDIKGENYNTLYYIYKSIQAAEKSYSLSSNSTQSNLHAWYGVNKINVFLYKKNIINNFIENIISPSKGARVIGFKEIRYFEIFNSSKKDLEEYLEFIKKEFNNSYLIFNVRNPEEVVNSSWWKKSDPKILKPKIEKFNAWAREYSHRNKCPIINYNDIIDPELRMDIIKRLFEYLNEDAPSDKTVKDLLLKKSKYDLLK